MISAADDSHPLRADRLKSLFKSSNGARVGFRPAFGFQHSQAARREGGRRGLSGVIEPRRARIAANALGDFNGDRPHILCTARMNADGGLAIALPFAAIERALRWLQRPICIEGSGADHAAQNLRTNRRR